MAKYSYSHSVINDVTGKTIARGFASKALASRLVDDASASNSAGAYRVSTSRKLVA